MYQTSKKFSLNTNTVLQWVHTEEDIRDSGKGRHPINFKRTAMHPDMEETLYREYRELCKKGLKVKGWWFRARAKQILVETQPGSSFSSLDGWFTRFKTRFRISKRRATNLCQKEPEDKRGAIQQFHRSIRRVAKAGDQVESLGRWTAARVANIDQTPLPFIFSSGETYADTGERSVWVHGGTSGLDKRQCTVQLTLLADGEPRMKPLLIFRGTGKRISFNEIVRYNQRVIVKFQANAWCDEDMMKFWVRQMWKPVCDGPIHLILDVHRAQTAEEIQTIFARECQTTYTYIPGGCTSMMQPVDVSFNRPFKSAVERLASQHMQENLQGYVQGKFDASTRRVLFTQWVGQAWEEVSADKEMVKRSFRKCGIAVAIDGSEDSEINIPGIEDYAVEEDDDEYTDPFADCD